MEQERVRSEGAIDCACGGETEHLFTTEDEDSVYKFYKCRRCGDTQDISTCK